jgi:TolA-binding protein
MIAYSFLGCATRNEIKRFKIQLDYLEASNAQMNEQISQLDSMLVEQENLLRSLKADQNSGFNQLATSIQSVAALIDDGGFRVNRIDESIENLRREIIQPPAKLDTIITDSLDTVIVEIAEIDYATLYESASIDQQRGNYELAILGYRDFLAALGDKPSELADDAQYGIAQCLMDSEQYDHASEEFQELIDGYPRSELLPSATYKIGIIHEKTGKTDKAKKTFLKLIEDYPLSSEAGLAKHRIENLTNDE